MKKLRIASVFVSAALLLAANVEAQQQQSLQSQAEQAQLGQADQLRDMQPGQQLQWSQKASDVLDKKIVSKDGKDLGTAKDLIIGRDGRIEYVILSAGGVLGIGGDRVAVPWNKISSTGNVDQLMADVSQSEIQRLSGDKKSQEQDEGSSRKAAQTRGDERSQPMPLAQVEPGHTKDFLNQKVNGKNGEELGQAKDILTSQEGKPMYVVVQDEAGKMHPVPARLVHTNPEQQKGLSADFDKQAFQSTPSFDQAQLAQHQQWEPVVRGYYESGGQGGQSQQQQRSSGMGQPQGGGRAQEQPPSGMGQTQNQ